MSKEQAMTLRYLNYVVNAEVDIPDDTLAKIIDDNHSCWGMAYADDGEINVEVTNAIPDVKGVKEMRSFAPKEAIFSFGTSLIEVPLKSMQPFPVLFNEDDKPLLMATIAGDFTKYSDPESDNSAEYNVRTKLLLPKFAKMYRMVKNNLPALLTELEDEVTAEEILNSGDTGGNAVITLLAANGWLKIYSRSTTARKLGWGFISCLPEDASVHAPKPASATQDVQTVPRKLTLQEKIALKRAGQGIPEAILTEEKSEPAPASVPAVSAPAPIEKEVAEPIAERVADEYEFVVEGPPVTMTHKNPIRDWYCQNWVGEDGKLVGRPPEGYMKLRPKVRVKRLKGKPVLSVPVKADKVEKGVVAKSFDALKDLVVGGEKKVLETSATPVVAQPVLPIISMGQEARVREEFLMDKSVKKFTGLTAEEINDPTKLKSQTEIKFPAFAAQFAPHVRSLADTVNWTPEIYHRLIRDYPEAAVRLMIDYKANWLNVCQKTKTPLFQEPPVDITKKAHNM
jgi:hypothetical protein